jgi:NADPH:quinone reductase-like Zn-dependent oxidoreductase
MQTEFRAIVHSEYGAPEQVLRIAKRQLTSDEIGVDDVLVKVIARPIHHGDIHILSALPQGGPVAPIPEGTLRIPGFEGATSPESDAFSEDLKQRGFSFVGSTVVYAYMQSVGMVNDHLVDCFRYREIEQLWRTQIEERKGNVRKEEADASRPVDEIR